jgi:DNA-binding PadR family transcriptional regulator
MIEHELLFLGLLAEGPKHGYEIKRQIEEDLLPNVGLVIKSIYYPLKKIEEAGLIEKETSRQGNWPEKYVYRITPKGKSKFNELMEESFISIERPFFQMDLSLYFLPLVDKAMAKKRLKVRLALLKRLVRELTALKEKSPQKSRSAQLILQHGLDLAQAEIASTDRLILSF